MKVSAGLGWTIAIIGLAAGAFLGAGSPLISTLLVMANAGRLLKFQELL